MLLDFLQNQVPRSSYSYKKAWAWVSDCGYKFVLQVTGCAMTLDDRRAATRNTINLLPPEVLSMIFIAGKSTIKHHHTKAQTTSRQLPFEIVVSHVTSHWRAIAINSPRLWNTIESTYSEPMALERLSAYLARSKASPLDVDFEIYQNPFTFDRSIMLYMILPHVGRWRQLSLGTNIGTASSLIHRHFRLLSAPLLKYLSVSTDEDAEHMHLIDFCDIQPQIFANGAPNLSTVQLGAFMIHTMRPPLATVTTLQLVEGDAGNPHASPFRVDYDELRVMLSALRGLINLSLDGDIVDASSWPANNVPASIDDSITLPSLRSLRIDMFSALNFIVAPSLDSLTLRDCADSEDSEDWEGLDVPKFAVLRTLIFYNCLFREFKNFFRVLPAVTNFTVDANDVEIVQFLGVENNGDAGSFQSPSYTPWPHLTVMSVPSLPNDGSCKASLCNMVSSRKSAGYAIRRLQLGRGAMDKMKTFGRLGWLKEQLQVALWEESDWPPSSV
jgi:hypothetical protein